MGNEIQQIKEVSNDKMLVFSSVENFELAQRMAKVLCNSTLVPKQFQGEANLGNCIIALEMSNRMSVPPLMVMQNLYVVYGNPSWSSKFLIGALNVCGRFSPIRYEFKGTENTDDWSCRVYATDNTNQVLHGAWVSIALAKKEGWYDKSGSKWKTMPELMLQYRAAAFFQRVYAPEISLGLSTAEEMEDIGSIKIQNQEEQETRKNMMKEKFASFIQPEEKIDDAQIISDGQGLFDN